MNPEFDLMDLVETFRKLVKERNLTLSDEADDAMSGMMKLIQKERGSQFDDARIVSNILSLAIHNMEERLESMKRSGNLPTPEQLREIQPEDFRIKYL